MFEISHDPLRSFDEALHEGRRLAQQRLFAGGTVGRAQLVNGAEYGASVAEQKGASRLLKMDS
jgi:hypothetical protein